MNITVRTITTEVASPQPISMYDQIINLVCKGERVTFEQINVDCRDKDLVYTRQLIMYFANQKEVGSLAQIGRKFNRDHATVIHAVKTIQNYLDTDKLKRKRIEEYAEKLDCIKDIYIKRTELIKIINPLREEISQLEQRLLIARSIYDNIITQIQSLNEPL